MASVLLKHKRQYSAKSSLCTVMAEEWKTENYGATRLANSVRCSEHAETVMVDSHASAWLGSIFTQLCLVWTTLLQVDNRSDHSGSHNMPTPKTNQHNLLECQLYWAITPVKEDFYL